MDNTDIKACAVIVTYNRPELLKKTMEALFAQTVPFKTVIIVDNASDDDTRDYCIQITDLRNDVIYRRLETNLGGSGGFYEGIKTAVENNCGDYIVVLDDDAFLPDRYNEILLKAVKDNPKVRCFTGNVKSSTGNNFNPGEEEYVSVHRFSFVSPAFDAGLIREIGYPEKDYFIWYDDTEYSIRVKKVSPIIRMNRAIVNHCQKDANVLDSLLWKKYYGIRNFLLMNKKHKNMFAYFFIRCGLWCRLMASCIIKQLIIERSIKRYKTRLVMVRTAFKDARKNIQGININYYPGTKLE